MYRFVDVNGQQFAFIFISISGEISKPCIDQAVDYQTQTERLYLQTRTSLMQSHINGETDANNPWLCGLGEPSGCHADDLRAQ